MDVEPRQAAQYLAQLEKQTDGAYLQTLADLPTLETLYRHALVEGGNLFQTLDDDVMGEDVEAAGLINLWVVARAIAEVVPRPLFTLVVQRSFRSIA